MLPRVLQHNGHRIKESALVLGEELIFRPGSANRIENGANTLLEFPVGCIERIELLGDVRMRWVNHAYVGATAGGKRYVPDFEYQLFVALPVEVHNRMPAADVLVHDAQQQRGLAHATHAGQVGLHGALVVCPINGCAIVLVAQYGDALAFRLLDRLVVMRTRHIQPRPGPLFRQQL